jgi:hypothetical protein
MTSVVHDWSSNKEPQQLVCASNCKRVARVVEGELRGPLAMAKKAMVHARRSVRKSLEE